MTETASVFSITSKEINDYSQFFSRHSNAGWVSSEVTVNIFKATELPAQILQKIWDLLNMNPQTGLDRVNFVVAMKFLTLAKCGIAIPDQIPAQITLYMDIARAEEAQNNQQHQKVVSALAGQGGIHFHAGAFFRAFAANSVNINNNINNNQQQHALAGQGGIHFHAGAFGANSINIANFANFNFHANAIQANSINITVKQPFDHQRTFFGSAIAASRRRRHQIVTSADRRTTSVQTGAASGVLIEEVEEEEQFRALQSRTFTRSLRYEPTSSSSMNKRGDWTTMAAIKDR